MAGSLDLEIDPPLARVDLDLDNMPQGGCRPSAVVKRVSISLFIGREVGVSIGQLYHRGSSLLRTQFPLETG